MYILSKNCSYIFPSSLLVTHQIGGLANSSSYYNDKREKNNQQIHVGQEHAIKSKEFQSSLSQKQEKEHQLDTHTCEKLKCIYDTSHKKDTCNLQLI